MTHNPATVDTRQGQGIAHECCSAARKAGDLNTAAAVLEEFSQQMSSFRERWVAVADTLGHHFLGPEAWEKLGVRVGTVPPLPALLTQDLLTSPCPLHPGQAIKDTHLLVLIPQTVNEELYSARMLGDLCTAMARVGDPLIDDSECTWRDQAWALQSPQRSEWVLIPKSDPVVDPEREGAHFRGKSVAEQEQVHVKHYREYRETTTLELATAALLMYAAHREYIVPDALRCKETTDGGGRVFVGFLGLSSLLINAELCDAGSYDRIGLALARELNG